MCLALAEVNKALHLTLEAFRVVVDILLCEHLSHIGSAGGISDKRCSAAYERNRLVARELQTLHKRECHEMACGQAVCRAVKADIKRCLAVVDKLLDFRFIGYLGDKPSRDELLINFH